MLGQLSGQEETDGSLYLSRRDGRSSVIVCETGSLGGYALEDVVDEAVHDGHGFAGNTGVGVNLLEHFVDVDGIALPPPPPLLLIPSALGLCLRGGLLGSFACCFGRHIRRLYSLE